MTGPSNNHAREQVGAALPADVGQAAKAVTKRVKPGKRPGLTAERIEKTRILVAELRTNPMTRDAIGEFLQYSPSGVRKYLADFRAAGILVLRDDLVQVDGQAVYSVVNDAHQIAAFLDGLSKTRSSDRTQSRKSALAIALGDKSRHIHVMADDTYFSVKPNRAPAAPDPLALPKNFFAPPNWTSESPPCQHFAAETLAKAPHFPESTEYRFDLEVAA